MYKRQVLARNGSVLAEFSGSVEGHMLTEPAGEGGFGYDPLFVPEGDVYKRQGVKGASIPVIWFLLGVTAFAGFFPACSIR